MKNKINIDYVYKKKKESEKFRFDIFKKKQKIMMDNTKELWNRKEMFLRKQNEYLFKRMYLQSRLRAGNITHKEFVDEMNSLDKIKLKE